jgi:hypothetical protein
MYLLLGLALCQLIHSSILYTLNHPKYSLINTQSNFWPDKHHIWSINPHQLTLTTAGFNTGTNEPDWVDHILGSKSVLFAHRGTHVSVRKMEKEDLDKALYYGKTNFNISSWQPCSFQFMGFAAVHKDDPFTVYDRIQRNIRPSSGLASLTIHHRDAYNQRMSNSSVPIDPIACYYRGLYENWREDSFEIELNHWVTMIFCPVITKATCETLNSHFIRNSRDYSTFQLTLALTNTSWTSAITVANRKVFKDQRFYISPTKTKNALGACLVIPYRSSDTVKLAANSMLIEQWVKYHLMLGLKVFVYDRGGANLNAFANYLAMKDSFMYHNFTIRELLDSSVKNITYDNTYDPNPVLTMRRYDSQGFDKSLTLSHCRFNAVINYGIKNVLVADFDEFLFCPAANATGKSQGHFLYELVDHLVGNQKQQITFQQRSIAKKTKSVRQCFIDMASKKQSLFDCLGSYQYSYAGHSFKSIHLGNDCPMTGYHQACPTKESPRSYDCFCDSAAVNPKICGMIHMSTRPIHYREQDSKLNSQEWNQETINASTNEIKLILDQRIDSRYQPPARR